MRILKLQAWEMKLLFMIKDLRKNESSWLKKRFYKAVINQVFVWAAPPTCVAIVAFGFFILMGLPLESGNVLSALATFRMLQDPINDLPEFISMVIQTKVSLDRIASHFSQDDIHPDVVVRVARHSSNIAVEISSANFCWDSSSQISTLYKVAGVL